MSQCRDLLIDAEFGIRCYSADQFQLGSLRFSHVWVMEAAKKAEMVKQVMEGKAGHAQKRKEPEGLSERSTQEKEKGVRSTTADTAFANPDVARELLRKVVLEKDAVRIEKEVPETAFGSSFASIYQLSCYRTRRTNA
ncbi:uncharacterized protein LOC143846465 isoform X3 [Tasmannia lanceolata]|uniref:uncharacterized protein LOC143846465 isoform X3 n=1 Tax=Tasmannia lanceolata TaxID=3420 RepID=UPI0040632251